MKYLSVKNIAFGILATGFMAGTLAIAHPHDTQKSAEKTPETTTEKVKKDNKKIWPYFGNAGEKADAGTEGKAAEKTEKAEIIGIEKMQAKKKKNKQKEKLAKRKNETLTPDELEEHFARRAERIERRLEQAKKRRDQALKKFEGKSNLSLIHISEPTRPY